MSGEHSHVYSQRRSRLFVVFILNLVLIGGLAAVGVRSHSLSVLAAAAEYVADALAILVVMAAHGADRREELIIGHSASSCEGNSDGHRHRVPITAMAALANSAFVSCVSVVVLSQALRRVFFGGTEVDGFPALLIALTAMVVMGAGALLLVGDDDLGMRSVLLDTAGDAAAAAGVALASAVIWITGGNWQVLDPIAAICVAVFVLRHAVVLGKESAHIIYVARKFGRVVSHDGHVH